MKKPLALAGALALFLAPVALAWVGGAGSGGDVYKWDADAWPIKTNTVPTVDLIHSRLIGLCEPDTGTCQESTFAATRYDGTAWEDSSGEAYVDCVSAAVGSGKVAYHARFKAGASNWPTAASWPSGIMCTIQHDGDDYQYRIRIDPAPP